MKTKTKFYIRESNGKEWDTIAEFDILIPNIDAHRLVDVNGGQYIVRFIFTSIEHDMIIQHVGLKKAKKT